MSKPVDGTMTRTKVLREPSPFLHPYVASRTPLIFAHQGASNMAPANTLTAFQAAVAAGADALETDVHWTKDGVIVVSHDETVDRCSNGSGYIRDMTLAELRRLDFGYRFTPDEGKSFPFRGKGVQIPTLAQVLAEFPTLRVNVDVKPKHPGSLGQLIRLICDAGGESRVLLASFHHQTLKRLRQMHRGLATSASPLETLGWQIRSRMNLSMHSEPYVALQVPNVVYRYRVVSQKTVSRAHKAGVPVHVWTIDNQDTMLDLLHLGVDGIVTNRPQLAVQVRQSWFDSQEVSHA